MVPSHGRPKRGRPKNPSHDMPRVSREPIEAEKHNLQGFGKLRIYRGCLASHGPPDAVTTAHLRAFPVHLRENV